MVKIHSLVHGHQKISDRLDGEFSFRTRWLNCLIPAAATWHWTGGHCRWVPSWKRTIPGAGFILRGRNGKLLLTRFFPPFDSIAVLGLCATGGLIKTKHSDRSKLGVSLVAETEQGPAEGTRSTKTMREVSPGDIVFSFVDTFIQPSESRNHIAGNPQTHRVRCPSSAYSEIERHVRDRLLRHLQRRSQRPYRLPQGEQWLQNLAKLGLIRMSGIAHA